MSNWKYGYIYGPYSVLKEWELQKFPEEDESSLRAFVLRSSAVYPKEQTGEFEGSPIYENRPNREDVVVLVSVRMEALHLVSEVEALPGVSVHMGATKERIKELYPEHALTPLPYIT